jgi:hypothetical protein
MKSPSWLKQRLTPGQDLAQVVANVLTGKGKHGFSDKHRGQLMVLTGMAD